MVAFSGFVQVLRGVVVVRHLLDRVQLCIQPVNAVFFIQQQDLRHQFTLVSTCCIAAIDSLQTISATVSWPEFSHISA
jgi:hypothetical protein